MSFFYEICGMLKTYFLKFFKYACLIIIVGTLFQCVNKVSNRPNFNVTILSELSIPSETSKTLLDASSITSSNENIFFVLEEECEKNEEIAKRNSLPVLTLTNLFRAFYSKEIRTPFFIFQPSSCSVSSIPLHVRNCIFLI